MEITSGKGVRDIVTGIQFFLNIFKNYITGRGPQAVLTSAVARKSCEVDSNECQVLFGGPWLVRPMGSELSPVPMTYSVITTHLYWATHEESTG